MGLSFNLSVLVVAIDCEFVAVEKEETVVKNGKTKVCSARFKVQRSNYHSTPCAPRYLSLLG